MPPTAAWRLAAAIACLLPALCLLPGLCLSPSRADAGTRTARPTVEAILRDDAGNVYVAGTFAGATASIGGIAMTKSPASGADLFVAMLTADGSGGWAANFGSARAAVRPTARAIARDGSGAIFIAGRYAGGSFDDLGLAGVDTATGFALRFDPRAGLVWSIRIGGRHGDIGDLALDPAEDALFLAGAAAAGQPARQRERAADALLARLDPATGAILWQRQLHGGGGNPWGQALVLDGTNRQLYLAGDAGHADPGAGIRPGRDGRFLLAVDYDGHDVEIADAGG